MKRFSVVLGVLVMAALLVLTGCSLRSEETRAYGVGDAGGALAGTATESTARGAIMTAGIGGTAGGVIGQQMDKQARELGIELPGATVERVGEGIQVTFPEGLLFALDSDDLSVAARGYLKALATSLENYPRTSSLIVGHTGAGAGDYNVGLSERRAQSVATLLSDLGVDRGRVRTAGRRATETSVSRWQNRVEVAIYADGALRRYATARD
jgi:outer membrane protein OmpA-like peptidoglycan-associated protein